LGGLEREGRIKKILHRKGVERKVGQLLKKTGQTKRTAISRRDWLFDSGGALPPPERPRQRESPLHQSLKPDRDRRTTIFI